MSTDDCAPGNPSNRFAGQLPALHLPAGDYRFDITATDTQGLGTFPWVSEDPPSGPDSRRASTASISCRRASAR